ncbi:MBOAT family O-acyltransferase [Clostridium hydrogeniformans]|uniref:MBOAT family O-acyltransferase n=1 Tax=Clostridium hydrogeniformans TaxID=349933 RepID=UPI00048110BF|nr:MBOAT family O-acyltransferase [Clostridium hydrogeniformans]
MVFTSAIFLFLFLPLTLVIYYLLPLLKLKNIWLLIVSLIFYAWGEPKFVIIMITEIVINYFLALLIDKFREEKALKLFFMISTVIFDIGILCFYKYINFFFININKLSSILGINMNFNILNLTLPIGISFFTFQTLSYVIDVYKKEVPVQRNILNLGLYISLFPQLVAGPIVRYIDVENEIHKRVHSFHDFYIGIRRFIIGFSKKILIANTLGKTADIMFSNLDSLAFTSSWIGIICYSFQIYYDFSGYSDMAIGLGHMFGFTFKENFNYPYISKGIQDFWRRWHISLSTWFRDYLYIPLGGNRKGLNRTYLNLFIVFFATGIWHGASWNFIVWGCFHGIFIILERCKIINLSKMHPILIRIYTLLVVIIGWVFFRIEGFRNSLKVIKSLFSLSSYNINTIIYDLNKEVFFILIIALIFSMPILKYLNNIVKLINEKIYSTLYVIQDISIFIVFIISITYMIASSYNPFIYFRF